MTSRWRLGLVVSLALAGTARAQTDAAAQTQPTAAAPDAKSDRREQPGESSSATTQPAPMPSLIKELPDYTGDLSRRSFLTGDWGGARTDLANHGILFDLEVTQFLQGNAHGGKNTKGAFEYGGLADFRLRLDSARMGLWPGGLIVLHGQTQFGRAVNRDAGALMTPNFDMLLPVPNDPGITTLSEYYFMQALSEKFVVFAGKIDVAAVGDRNAFAGDLTHTTQFLNTAFNANPILFNAGPYTTLAAGAIVIPTKWLQVATFVADNDPNGAATTTGFNTAFHGRNWLTVGQEYDFTIKPFGKEGHQRLGWFYTTRDFVEFGADSRINLPFSVAGRGFVGRNLLPRWLRVLRFGDRAYSLANPAMRPDDWGIYYNFDQYVYNEAEDPTQGVGVFGRFGWSTGEANIFETFYSIGLGGKGTLPQRDRDTWGLGYYLANVSDKIDIVDLSSEQGVELYYNIEVTPWLHVTPDLQVIIAPGAGFQDRDVSIVYGLRAQMSF